MSDVLSLPEIMERRVLDQTIASTRRLLESLVIAKGEDEAARRRLLIAASGHCYAGVVSDFCRLTETTTQGLIGDLAMFSASLEEVSR